MTLTKHKKNPRQNETERLITLAQATQSDDFSPQEGRLADLVSRLIARGSDRSIERALDYLGVHGDLEAAARILFWAEDAASTMDIIVSPDKVSSDPTIAELTCFLVPLVFITPSSFTLPLNIPLTETLNQLAQSFRQHHLIDALPTLILLPHLYRLQDLPSTWSARYQWLQQLLAAASSQPYHLPPPSLEPENSSTSEHSATIHLRFLLGAVVLDSEVSHRPLWDQDIPWEESDTMYSHGSAWQDTVIALLQQVLPDTIVLPDLPDLWSDALTSSLNLWNHVVLDTTWDWFCRESAAPPEAVVADVRWVPEEPAWSVTFATPFYRGPTWLWMCPDDPVQERHQLLDALHDHNISRIQLDMRDL